MDREKLRDDVAQVVRSAEIRAVAHILQSGQRPTLGQYVDYAIDSIPLTPVKRSRPYRVAVEQWHIDAAERLLRRA